MASLRQPQNFYAGNRFNRLAERRTDAKWLAEQLASGKAYLVPLWQGRSLVIGGTTSPTIALIEHERLAAQLEPQQLVLLGEFRDKLCFAVELQGRSLPACVPSGRIGRHAVALHLQEPAFHANGFYLVCYPSQGL